MYIESTGFLYWRKSFFLHLHVLLHIYTYIATRVTWKNQVFPLGPVKEEGVKYIHEGVIEYTYIYISV